jgi:hypothetical protein
MSDKYVLDGHVVVPCDDLMAWARFFQDTEGRRVAQTEIGDVCVSTVFLGLDHQFGEGPPLIFETLVMGGAFNDEVDRYSTWEEAEEGHTRMVSRVRDQAE